MKSKLKFFTCFFGTAIFLSGCGNIGALKSNTDGSILPTQSDSYSLVRPDSIEERGYSCPKDPNVYPQTEAPTLDTDYHFRVCSSDASPSSFVVKGWTSFSETICVFPARVMSNQTTKLPEIKPWTDSGSKMPYSKCLRVRDERAVVDFPAGVEPNALFVVDQQDDYAMKSCLLSQNPAMCPKFSYGTL